MTQDGHLPPAVSPGQYDDAEDDEQPDATASASPSPVSARRCGLVPSRPENDGADELVIANHD
jgi:hypothetical protein